MCTVYSTQSSMIEVSRECFQAVRTVQYLPHDLQQSEIVRRFLVVLLTLFLLLFFFCLATQGRAGNECRAEWWGRWMNVKRKKKAVRQKKEMKKRISFSFTFLHWFHLILLILYNKFYFILLFYFHSYQLLLFPVDQPSVYHKSFPLLSVV